MDEHAPEPGDIYTLHEVYISDDYRVENRETRLVFKLYNRGEFLLNTMGTDKLHEAKYLIFNYTDPPRTPYSYVWIPAWEYPIWINPDPKDKPGDIHYKVILYTP